MRRSGVRRRLSALLFVGVLGAVVTAGPTSVLSADGDPPHIIFAGEMLSAPSYDHVVVLYDKRLDTNIAIPLDDFRVRIGGANGTSYTPIAGTYLLSGLVGLFDESGSTFLQLQLPTGVTIDAATPFEVTYTGHGAPLSDLSLTAAADETFAGEVVDAGGFAWLGALVDAGNATNRLTLVFVGQVDLTSIPAPSDFHVYVDGPEVAVDAVEPRAKDIGMGIVDLVLASHVRRDAIVDFSYAPAPTSNHFKARQGGLVLDPFSQTGVTVLIPPNSVSEVVGDGGTVSTSLDPPSPSDSLTTSVTTADGGPITIDETPTDPAPTGYTFFGEQVSISAPDATDPNAPLILIFGIDATLVPTGQTAASIVVFRNGVPLGTCPALPIVSPCVAARDPLAGGDIRITVYTLAASTWNFGVVTPYAFGGFRSPVDGAPIRNLAKAGTAIPVKFGLGGDRGMAIFTAGSPASQRVACDTSSPMDAIEETVNAGASSLRYDPGSDTYTYVWKTDKSWVGTCRKLILSFGDGSQQSALFQFK
jgi:hypothetical protein